VAGPPVADGAVCVAGNRIVSAGRWRDVPPGEQAGAQDLGDVILMPGLVNAHCHLDYTGMAGQFPPPAVFTDWLKLITGSRGEWGYSDFAESWLTGAKMLLRTGTTTVGDIEMLPELLPEMWDATPLRVLSFLEMTGVKSRRAPVEIMRLAMDKLNSLPPGRSRAALSPHAPYSTTPELLRLAAETARKRKLRLTIHVAESDQEFDMFTHGRGAMFDWLGLIGRDMADCGLGSPVQHLERNGVLGENLLAVHVNYLAPGDAALLGRRKVSVVHCPRSHVYFGHQKFPRQQLAKARVNLCLGTDSLASVYIKRKQTVELSLFDEMRQCAAVEPGVPPKTIAQMVTVNAARALGLQGRVGELVPSAFADLITLPFTGKAAAAYEAVVQHRGEVAASMIDGQWAIAP
jgi:aminodeoxyfutalosine deaminase